MALPTEDVNELYLEVFTDVDQNGRCRVPLRTLLVLFGHKYWTDNDPRIKIYLVRSPDSIENGYDVDLKWLTYKYMDWNDVLSPANLCLLPVFVLPGRTTCVAGLCAVIRQMYKVFDPKTPLLGFKQNTLSASAEASIWTRFCEVDALEMVDNVLGKTEPKIPHHSARFEAHMAQPVRVHNIGKAKRDSFLAEGLPKPNAKELKAADVDHVFAEGGSVTLADFILFPCFHIVISVLMISKLKEIIPLTCSWYAKMCEIKSISLAAEIILSLNQQFRNETANYVIPQVPQESLYKTDPRRYKPRHRIFTKQDDIEASLEAIKDMELDMIETKPFGDDVPFNWESIPWDAHPSGGEVPKLRSARKAEQLEGMARAALKVAVEGDILVDFCAGSGHLGLLLAHSLPDCTVVLVENKEESLNRARKRAENLRLSNILFCQSNVDYFRGSFTIGVSLHACGVATDLVMETCIKHRACFICCPCCYGSVQPNHMVQYPRSKQLRELPLEERQYLVLGHAADQTHDAENAKTEQGFRCMNIIDGDRCLRAREAGYQACLFKLHPTTCTPKNNLLIGVPNKSSSNEREDLVLYLLRTVIT